MTHDERLRLINRPFPTVQLHGGRSWGGANTERLNSFGFGHGGGSERDSDDYSRHIEQSDLWRTE